MREWSRDNKGFKYLMTVIDVFSKYAWSIPLKDKTGITVLNAMQRIIKESGRKPHFIWVDQGKEFYNKHFDEWLKENKITKYSTFGEHKSAVVERFNRTLKNNMWKRFTAENTRNWISMIDALMTDYNTRIHSSIKMSPTQASLKENAEMVVNNARYRTIPKSKPKFKVGDKVRISRLKQVFEKGYLPNWSEEVFTIHQVKKTNPVTYKVKDSADIVLDGSFYNEDLQKTNQEVFRIEKVIRKKKIDGIEHGLVKWMGYSNKYNQWIPMKDLQKV